MANYVVENFTKVKVYRNFIQGSHKVLINTLSEFFSADVELNFEPLNGLKNVQGDVIREDLPRNVHILDKNTVLLVPSLQKEKQVYVLGIILTSKNIGDRESLKIFNVVAGAISTALKQALPSAFRKCYTLFNEQLITCVVSRYVSKTGYDCYKMHYLLDFFNALRTTTFEGKYFSTGLIITKSLFDFKEQVKSDKGYVAYLNSPKKFSDSIDTRYWYLVDGYTSFYLTDLKKDIHYMYIYNTENQDYLSKILLGNSLHRIDVLLRTNNGRELSVITSNHIEFIYQENVWRFRDYQWLRSRILEELQLQDAVYNAILYFVLYCSKNDTSSIIWIPKDIEKVGDLLKTTHSISKKTFNVIDKQYDGLIKRLLSSDGATVICQDGTIRYYGCIIKMEVTEANVLKGTGETAASRLASNGIAIKISQDGTIKIFLNNKTKIIKF